MAKHDELGQTIDFSDLKTKLDKIFLFDIVSILYDPLRRSIEKSRNEAGKVIDAEFGSPIRDSEGYRNRQLQLQEVPSGLKELFAMSIEGNVAQDVLDWITEVETVLLANFKIKVDLPSENIAKLKMLSELCHAGPIKVTDELIEMTNRSQ